MKTAKPEPRPSELSALQRELLEYRRQLYRPTPSQTVVEWSEANIKLTARQTEHPGPFSITLRPYTREPLEAWKDQRVSEVVLCWGSQTAKTTTLMAGAMWMICEDPGPTLWLMPTENLARSFSKTRWMVALEDCPRAVEEFPTDRHKLTHLEQHFRRCTVNFIGSNSPAQLASRPIRILVADEVDKFADATDTEADALDLAEQRTKAFGSSKAFLTSTPTVVEGRIWQRFLRGDRRFYFIPCPHCGEKIKLLWGQVRWDQTAKDAEGAWDMNRVRQSARYLCQKCGLPISDAQKFSALRHGVWIPENSNAAPGIRSYHLSSLYAPDRKCTWGALAVQFLDSKNSLLGLQGFINGTLAEPWESQDTIGDRIELVTSKVEPTREGTRLMTIDCQARSPFFWWIVRHWEVGRSEGIAAGSAETWEEIEEIQKRFGVRNEAVAVDSGYGARSDSEVYSACVNHSEIMPTSNGLPVAIGWVPTKGIPGRKMWRDEKSKLSRPYFLRDVDPFEGTTLASRVRVGLVGFSADYAKDLLEDMRKRRGGIVWSVSQEMATETYWRHLDGEIKEAIRSKVTGRTVHQWRPRSRHWPNHLLDCEAIQVILASYLGLLDLTPKDKEPEE